MNLLDWIAPRDLSCALCGSQKDVVQGYGICAACKKNLPVLSVPYAVLPGVPVLAPMLYAEDAERLIRELKFHARGGNAYVLGALMTDCLFDRDLSGYVLVPVSQHWTRTLSRGMSQSLYLAREVGRRTGLPVVKALKTVRRTAHQTGQGRTFREENLRGAFSARKNVPKKIILVDDVVTTGATMRECAAALLAGGAQRIICLAAARVPAEGRG